MRHVRWLMAGLLAIAWMTGRPGAAAAQGWTAQLVLSPMPSAFVSDWEVDPSVAELIVTNGTPTATDVTFHYTLSRGGQVVLSGVTDAHTVPGNQSVTFNASSSFGGKADWNRELQDLVTRTGRLPEGEYQGCVALAGPGGAVLVERECASFTVGYPDPPFLVHPMNGDTVHSQAPLFEWQPVHLPTMADARVGYVLQIAEVNPSTRQAPEVALSSNILHYVEPGLTETSHQYPVGALPLVSGRTYAWRVQALDATGRPIASNQGRSEIWTFVYREPESEAQRTVARVEVTASRDTLRFAGDTARFEALAYDADNVEIAGRTVRWQALDTTIARVDSTGVVTAGVVGQTRIVATIDGAADSALTAVAPRRLAVRFERYDASSGTTDFLELINSGSFDEIVPALMERLEAGELRIPIPRIPSMEAARQPGAPGPDDTGALRRAGPHAPGDDAGGVVRAVEPCDVATDATVHVDRSRKAWSLRLAVTHSALQCALGTLVDLQDRDTTAHYSFILVASWMHPGLPRAFVAVKTLSHVPLPIPAVGLAALSAITVLNVSRAVTIESSLLPKDHEDFIGTESFDAGTGLTIHARLRCRDASKALCQALSAINPDNPEITLKGFAGITASESSVNLSGIGSSVAWGMSLSATLPVRHLDWDIGKLSIDSSQTGLMFAAQDSVVYIEDPNQAGDHYSIGVAPTLTVWMSAGGKVLQVDGSLGFEWDPESNQPLRPKLVFSAQMANTLHLGRLRLGNPQVVVTTPVGRRDVQEATEVAVSGTWGFGPNDGFGIDAGGGDVRGDAGGASTGGVTGFEELGRGQAVFSIKGPPSVRQAGVARTERHDAYKAFSEQVFVVRRAQEKVDAARKQLEQELFGSEEYAEARRALREAELQLKVAEAELDRRRKAKTEARESINPPVCSFHIGNRCVTWTGRFSLGNGSILDIVAYILRMDAQ